MPTYTFTPDEKNQYFNLTPSFSGFGNQPDRDYIVLCVYNLNNILLIGGLGIAGILLFSNLKRN